MYYASLVEDTGVNVDDEPNDSYSDDKEVGVPKLMRKYYDSDSESSDEDSDTDDDGEDYSTWMTSDKETNETLECSTRKLTKWDQLKADAAQRFQYVVGHLSEDTIIYSAGTTRIKNSLIARRDMLLAKYMLGQSKHAIERKTARSKPDSVDIDLQKIDVPRSIMNFRKDEDVAADVTHANDFPLLTTASENTHCGEIADMDKLKCDSLEFELKQVIRSHAVRGFCMALLVVDAQLKLLKDRNLLDVATNIVPKEEHVTKIEC